MSRIAVPDTTSANGATADIYARVKKISGGRVPNTCAALGYLVPESLAAVLDVQGPLNTGSLRRQEHEIIKLLIDEKTGCDVCAAAHSFVEKLVGLAADVLRAIRAGQPKGDAKRHALVRFVSHLHTTSGTISEEEFSRSVRSDTPTLNWLKSR